MPRMGYGYSAGPEDMATGNPFYSPMSPTPDWASGIAAFYQNLQQAKDRKRAQQLQDEEMRWQKYLQEQTIKESAWKEQDRAIAEQERQQKAAEERGKRTRENMDYAAANAPLPPIRQAQVADFHKYDRVEFSKLPGSRQRELENEMTAQTGDINRVKANNKPQTSAQDRLYEWQASVSRSAELLNGELERLAKRQLEFDKIVAQNAGDNEVANSLKPHMDDIAKRARKVQMILHRLSLIKVGSEIPKDLQTEIEKYINPPDEPSPLDTLGLTPDNPLGMFGPGIGVPGGPPRKKTKAEESLPPGFMMK